MVADAAMGPGIAKCGLARAMVVVFVLLTAAVSLAWSHSKLMSQDEMYEFQTDSVRSLAELVHVQRTWPISLDPLLYPRCRMGRCRRSGRVRLRCGLPALAGFSADAGLPVFLRAEPGGRAGAEWWRRRFRR